MFGQPGGPLLSRFHIHLSEPEHKIGDPFLENKIKNSSKDIFLPLKHAYSLIEIEKSIGC